jgi:hypothetical protein
MVRELVGYRLTPDGYEELSPNAAGWLWIEPVNIWLSLDGEDLACYDEAGNLMQDYVGVSARAAEETEARIDAENRAAEETQARIDAENRAAEEAQARIDAEERIRQLETELRRRTS